MAGVAAAFLADNPQATPAEVKAAIVQVRHSSCALSVAEATFSGINAM